MTSNDFEEVGGLKNDCQAGIVSGVESVLDVNVSRVVVSCLIKERLRKGRRVGS